MKYLILVLALLILSDAALSQTNEFNAGNRAGRKGQRQGQNRGQGGDDWDQNGLSRIAQSSRPGRVD